MFKQRRSIALIIALIGFMFALPTANAFDTTLIPVEFNEYDGYVALSKETDTELLANGYTNENIAEIRQISFVDAIYERSFYSDIELQGLGYSKQEINRFHEINRLGKNQITENDLRALSGTCTGDAELVSWSASKIIISYTWEWDHSPILCYVDAMGVRWAAIGTDGAVIDTTADAQQTEAMLLYYDQQGESLVYSYQPNFVQDASFNTISANFPVVDSTTHAWAKKGELDVCIRKDPSITRSIYYVKFAGLYGHSQVTIGAPSISVTPGSDSISFSFTGGISINNIAGCKYKIYAGGRKEPILA